MRQLVIEVIPRSDLTFIALIDSGHSLAAGRGDTEREAACAAVNSYYSVQALREQASGLNLRPVESAGGNVASGGEIGKAPNRRPAIREMLEGAIPTATRLRMQYTNRDGEDSEREVIPVRIDGRRGPLGFSSEYLIAIDTDKDEPRTFRLDRIVSLERA